MNAANMIYSEWLDLWDSSPNPRVHCEIDQTTNLRDNLDPDDCRKCTRNKHNGGECDPL